MRFLDKLIGVPQQRLRVVALQEIRFSTSAVEVKIKGMTAYEDPEDSRKLLQSSDFALELAGQISDHISAHEPITPMEDYATVLSPDAESKIAFVFRIYEPTNAASVFSNLTNAVSEAMQKHGINFVGFR